MLRERPVLRADGFATAKICSLEAERRIDGMPLITDTIARNMRAPTGCWSRVTTKSDDAQIKRGKKLSFTLAPEVRLMSRIVSRDTWRGCTNFHANCVFRSKPARHSIPNPPPIPVQTSHSVAVYAYSVIDESMWGSSYKR
jgi:hypothetical protein